MTALWVGEETGASGKDNSRWQQPPGYRHELRGNFENGSPSYLAITACGSIEVAQQAEHQVA